MPVYSYNTLKDPARGVYREKGSRFLAFAYPVSSEEEVKEILLCLRKEYFDAKHHCFAWMLGAEMKHFRAFDDGEPNHSAGNPILNQIRSKNLTNVLVVVVRYFGGIKLGISGLVSAYKAAAEDALNSALVVRRDVTEDVTIQFNYGSTSDVMGWIKEFDLIIVHQDFGEKGMMQLSVPAKEMPVVMSKLERMIAMGSAIEWKINSPA